MRCVPLVLLTLLICTGLASAQTAGPSTAVTAVVPVNPDVVVARVMAFDLDRDGRIVRSELPERMHNLLAGDWSGDDALDRAEIRALTGPGPAPAAATTVPGFARGGGYVFGDRVSLSTRDHVLGALEDLRLDDYTSGKALPMVTRFMDRLEAHATSTLVTELEPLLPAATLERVKAAVDSQLSRRPREVATGANSRVTTSFFIGGNGNLEMLIIQMSRLQPESSSRAASAIERFRERIRPGDAERAQLLDELKGVLGDEERENFGAALARRPLVKSAAVDVVKTFEQLRQRVSGNVVTGDAVFRTPIQPQRVVEP